MNVSIPIAIPDDYSVTERRIIENAFQDLVDTLRQLRLLPANRGSGRELALQFHLDEGLTLRGAHIDWKARTDVASTPTTKAVMASLNGSARR